MKKTSILLLTLFAILHLQCSTAQSVDQPSIDRIVVDSTDTALGYYLAVKPKSRRIRGVLVLLPGFGQQSEDIFLDTDLHKIASQNDLLTIGFSGITRLSADTLIREKLSAVLTHLIAQTGVDKNHFVLGGFS